MTRDRIDSMVWRTCRTAIAAAVISACVSCQSYYKVTNLRTNQSYYTYGWLPGMYGRHGYINFDELGTGDHLVIQDSRATLVSSTEAKANQVSSDPHR